MTPFSVPMTPPKTTGSQHVDGDKDSSKEEGQRYLNVNLVYELWKDIKFQWLQHRWAGHTKSL